MPEASKTSGNVFQVELNPVESFNFMFKNLWFVNTVSKLRINILDTILFHEGEPLMWLFTSEQTGEIMKKKADKITSTKEIVKVFKSKANSIFGLKTNKLKPKIAIIWYFESITKLSSYLVNEAELTRVLNNKLTEIVAIQVYLGGLPLKGNGLFEHTYAIKMPTINHYKQIAQPAQPVHSTYEHIDSIYSNNNTDTNYFTSNNNNKLHITEHQHDAIRHICNKITHFISNNAYGNISITNISIQVVFNSQWIPYVVSASNITVSNAPQEYITNRELMIFPAGREPTMPQFTEQSLHLPIHWTEHNDTYQDSEVMFKTAGPFAGNSTGGVVVGSNTTNNTININTNESNGNKNNNNNHHNSSHITSEQHPLKQKDWYNDNNSNNNINNINNNAVLPQVIPLSGRSAQSNRSQTSQTSKNSKNSINSRNSSNNNSNSGSNSNVNRQLFGEHVHVIDTIIDAAGAAAVPLPVKTIQAIQQQQQYNKSQNHTTATTDNNTTLESHHNNQNTTENKSGSRSDSPLHRASTSPLLPSQMLLLHHDSNNKPFSQHSSFDSAMFSTVSHNINTHSTVGSEFEVHFHNGFKHNHVDNNVGNNTNNSNNSSNNNNNNIIGNNNNINIGDSNGNIPLSARSNNNNNNVPLSARSVNSKNNNNQVPIAVPQSPKSPKQVSIYTPADTTERNYTGDIHTNNYNNKVRPQSASSISVNSNNKAGALRNIVHNNRTSDTNIPVPTAIPTAGNFAPVLLQSRTQGSRLTVLPVRDSRPSTYHFVNHIPNVDVHKQITGQVDSSDLYDTTSDVQNSIFNTNNEDRLAQLNALELQQKQQLQQIQYYKEQIKDYKSVLQNSATTDTLLTDNINHNNNSNVDNYGDSDIDNEMHFFNNTFNLAENSNNNNTTGNNTNFTTGNNKNKKQLPSTDHRYMDTTETAHLKQSFYKLSLQDQHNAEKELAKVFNKRRPISAPHTRQKSRLSSAATAIPLTSSGNNPMEWTFAEKPEHEVPGAGILKVLPLSGVHCFGDYCQFIENRNKDVSMLYSGSEHHNNINSNNPTQSTVYNQSTHTPLTQPILIPHQAPTFNNHFPQQIKSTDCPHKLSYKSILLSRAEESFIGTGLDDKFDSLWDQIKLSNFTTEQLIAYFVKRHLNRVAVKCQEEGRVMSYNSNVAPMTAWNALNKVYRKMVYAKALSHVHPSRFYYTVPLCEVCFRIYSFTDIQRDLIVLHNPTNSQLHSNSQHLQHLNSTDNLDDNNDLNNGNSDNNRHNNANSNSGNNIHVSFRTNNNSSPQQSPLRTSRSNDHSPVRSRSTSPFRDEFFDIPIKDNTKVLIHRERDQTFSKHNHISIKTIKESTSRLRKQDKTVGDVAYLAKYEKQMRVVPENYTDHDKLNLTLDRGIGSRGPIHSGKQVSVGINIKGGRVSSWVKLMRQSAESNHSYGSDFQGNTAKRSKPKGVRSSREKKSSKGEFEQQHSNTNNTGSNNISSNSSNEYKNNNINNNNSNNNINNQAAIAPQYSNRNTAALHHIEEETDGQGSFSHSHAEEQQYVRDRNNHYNNDNRNNNNYFSREEAVPVDRNQIRPHSAIATTAANISNNTTSTGAGTIHQRMNKSKSMITVPSASTTATATAATTTTANTNANNNSNSSGVRQRLNKTLPIRKLPTPESIVSATSVRAEDDVDTVANHLQQQFEQQQQSQQSQQQNLYLQQHANNPYVPQNNNYTNNPIAIIPPLHYMHNPLLGNLQPTMIGTNGNNVTAGISGNSGSNGGIIDEYAFSCLPFMAAPFLPVMQTKNATNFDGSIVGGSLSGNNSMKSGIADV